MKRFFLLTVALLTVWAAAAQMRFVDATELNLIGKALPTPHPYHRIDTVAYKGFTKGENQQVRCSAGLALVFKTNSTRIDLEPQYTSFVYAGASTPRVASEGFDLYIRKDGEWLHAAFLRGARRDDQEYGLFGEGVPVVPAQLQRADVAPRRGGRGGDDHPDGESLPA